MTKQALVGQFEQLVLTAILENGENSYGVTIHGSVSTLSEPRSVSLGAVYATLDRLEDKGLVESWLSDPTPERGGRSKRHYRLKAAGEQALRDSALMSKRVYDRIESIWGVHTWKPARQS